MTIRAIDPQTATQPPDGFLCYNANRPEWLGSERLLPKSIPVWRNTSLAKRQYSTARVGHVVGFLTVTAYSHAEFADKVKVPRWRDYWLCRCECGAVKPFAAEALMRRGIPRSCGDVANCNFARTVRRENSPRLTHGWSDTPEHNTWMSMHDRCLNPRHTEFHLYGGRGIVIAPEWQGPTGFMAFLNHVGPRPSSKHSIDRYPNNDGNYEPGNVRWATKSEQNRNLRRNRWVEYRGERRVLAEWCEILGLPYNRTMLRIHRGWPVEQAFFSGASAQQEGGESARDSDATML